LAVSLKKSVITIVGLGLMGGSLGKTLVRGKICREVRALVRRDSAAHEAVRSGVVHLAGSDGQSIIDGADIVIFAVPVRTIESQVKEFEKFYRKGAVITDMGSVKAGIVKSMESLRDDVIPVGGHPMCGKEKAGLENADPELFKNKVWALTPCARTTSEAMDLLSDLITAVGARLLIIDPEDHDRAVACISHLPYLMASTLVAVTERSAPECPAVWELASTGFKDTSRVAAGDLNMMLDILVENKTNLLELIDRACDQFGILRELILSNDEESLRGYLEKIKLRRSGMFL
jgi:prephenate dehydrogenase